MSAEPPAILVAGLINIETTLRIDAFPLTYEPVRYPFFGVNTTVAGVGYNIAAALATLGQPVDFLSLVGDDYAGDLVRTELARLAIQGEHVLSTVRQTAQSVIVYDPAGQRAIFTDLKDIQEVAYPQATFAQALSGARLAVLCNINFTRPMLAQAKAAGVTVATDVHAIGAIDDSYNADYMQHADILFQSHEHLPVPPRAWIEQLWATYQTPVSVVGMGSNGALLGLYEGRRTVHVPAVRVRPVVNTIGAGDALFSAFLYGYLHSGDPEAALRQAVVFAAWKIGGTGAAEGFLDAGALRELVARVYGA